MPTYIDDLLTIQVRESTDEVSVVFTGRSTAREPNRFLAPILKDVLAKAARDDRRVVLDFFQLDYMNSATIAPIAKMLEAASRGTARITIQYNQGLHWQDLSFTALRLFQTDDERVLIRALD